MNERRRASEEARSSLVAEAVRPPHGSVSEVHGDGAVGETYPCRRSMTMTTKDPAALWKQAGAAALAYVRITAALEDAVKKALRDKVTGSLTKELILEAAAKAQDKAAKDLFKEDNIEECDKLLKAVGADILKKFSNCSVIYGPPKTKIRAKEKVDKDYGGDWWQIKDVVRMTIVAPDEDTMKKVAKAMRKEICVPSLGRGLAKAEPPEDKLDNLPESACGYTGCNFVALLENWRPGEIQLNIPGTMYGQMGTATFEAVVGKGQAAKYQEMYGVEGGQGHIYYELFRPHEKAAQKPQIAVDAQSVSQQYFRHLRKKAAEAKKAGPEVQKAMDAFAKKYAAEITKLHH
jgi:hypothetical protein